MGFLATLVSQMVGHGQAESAPPTPQQAAAQSTAMIQVRPRPRSRATDSVSVTSLAQASSKNLLSSNLESFGRLQNAMGAMQWLIVAAFVLYFVSYAVDTHQCASATEAEVAERQAKRKDS